MALKTRAFYEEFAAEYASSIPYHVTGGMKDWLDAFVADVPRVTPIFEIGSGTGRDATYLEAMGYSVQRSEIAVPFIGAFEEQGISVSKFDVLKDSFPGEQHLVFANSVFCHLTNRQLTGALEKIYDALVPGGRFGFNTKSDLVAWHGTLPNKRLPGARYFSHWPPSKLRAEVESVGFSVLECFEQPAILRPTQWVNLVVEKRPA